MMLIKYFLTGVLYDCFNLTYVYLNDKDKARECYNSLKKMIKAHLYVGFFTVFFIKRVSLKRFYLYMELMQSNATFKQKI